MRSSRAFSMFFTAGTPNFHTAMSNTKKDAVPQRISFLAGSNGDGAFWQSSAVTSPPLASFSKHCLAASVESGFAGWMVSAAYAGAANKPTTKVMPSTATSA